MIDTMLYTLATPFGHLQPQLALPARNVASFPPTAIKKKICAAFPRRTLGRNPNRDQRCSDRASGETQKHFICCHHNYVSVSFTRTAGALKQPPTRPRKRLSSLAGKMSAFFVHVPFRA